MMRLKSGKSAYKRIKFSEFGNKKAVFSLFSMWQAVLLKKMATIAAQIKEIYNYG